MRVAIFGTGGAGGYFGAHLARAGEAVAFIARGAHLDAIRKEGLAIETPRGELLIKPARAAADPAEIGPVDVVILGVKAWQVAEAAELMRPLIGPETFVVPLQNGVEAAAQLAQALGERHVVGGLCTTISMITAPGRIKSIGEAHSIKFGELSHRPSARTTTLQQTFERAGVRAEVPANIDAALWEKFLFVVSFGGVGALTRSPVGVVRSQPGTRRMLETCMREIFAVARAYQIPLEAGVIEKTLAFLDTLPAQATTSLQRDIISGKPSELEAWNGAVVRLGREAGVPTPLHELIYESLLPQERRARGVEKF